MSSEVPAQSPRWSRWLPGLAVLLGYRRAWLRGDLLAGVTVAAYLVPQVMAYAAVAGLPAKVGLVACIGPFLAYALLGSSRQLSVGPESTVALMTAAGVGAMTGVVGQDRYGEVAALLAVSVGLLCLLGFVGRLGFLATFLSRPVLIGYLTGVSVLMVVSQLDTSLGITVTGGSTCQELVSLARALPQAHLPTALLAGSVLAALLVLRRLAPSWPGPLLVMVVATVVVWLVGAQRLGIALIGSVPPGLPAPRVPSAEGVPLALLVPAAAGIALVAYSDNILNGRAFADSDQDRLDPTQEFLALGAANLAAGLSQGFPVSSSSSRTALGDAVGSRTQLHSLVAIGGILATVFLLNDVLAQFPAAALAAVVVYAATGLIDIGQWRRVARFRTSEAVLAGVTALVVVFAGVLTGIAIAVGLSVLDLLRRMARPHDGILGYVPGLAGMHDIDDYPTADQAPGIVVYRYDCPLFFANADDFLGRATRAATEAPGPVHWFLLNAEAIVEIDLTAVDALDRLRLELEDRGILFAMARVKQDLRQQLEAAGFVEQVGADLIFPTLPTAMAAYASWLRHHLDVYPDLPPGVALPPLPPASPRTPGNGQSSAPGAPGDQPSPT